MPQSLPCLAFYWPAKATAPALVRFLGRTEPDEAGGATVLLRAGRNSFEADVAEVLTMTAQADRLLVNLILTPGHA